MSGATLTQPSTWTLRVQVLASLLTLFTIVMLITGTATVLATRSHLDQQLQAQLTGVTGRIGVPDRHDRPGFPDVPEALEREERGDTVLSLTVNADGSVATVDGFPNNRVVNRQEQNDSLDSAQIAALLAAGVGNHPERVSVGGDVGTYLVARQVGTDGTVTFIGVQTKFADEAVEQLVKLVALGTVLGLVVVAVGGNYLIRRNLEPLTRVAATARRVSALKLDSGDVALAERVPATDTDEHTEVGQVGAALNTMLDNVEGALQARQESEMRVRQFVADASHELRTPLASIRGYAELSRRETAPVPSGVTHALGRVESEALRMQGLVEDLLLLARLDSGRPLERLPVDLSLLAVDVVSDAHAAAPDHRFELDLPDEPVEVPGDQARLHQVLANLLANARTHTPPGTRVVTRVRREGAVVRLSVTDDGPGIPDELAPRVFERFTRGEASRVRTNGSTGLGLSIVAAVGQAHGGRVELSSRPGETTFSVLLPATP